jgi:hypothetical protein
MKSFGRNEAWALVSTLGKERRQLDYAAERQ